MSIRISIVTAIMIPLWFSGSAALAQESQSRRGGGSNDQTPSAIFSDIQAGLRSGDVTLFSKNLAKQVYLNLPDIAGGFFSDNQATYILKDYLKAHRMVSFKLSTTNMTGPTPFATGGGTYLRRGNPELIQVYIALKKSADRWVIAQFSVF
jgi:hypothetical protein